MLPTISNTLRPLRADLERVPSVLDPAELARLGRTICSQLQALPTGSDFPASVVDLFKQTAVVFFPKVSAAEAVASAVAIQGLSPVAYPNRTVLHFLPLRIGFTLLLRINRTSSMDRLRHAAEILSWVAECLGCYEQRGETVPSYLWERLRDQLRQLDPAGEKTEPVLQLLIRLTPHPYDKLPQAPGPHDIGPYGLFIAPPLKK